MIRLRSQKLLSGVSTLAVLATFGAVDPLLADTIAGPGNVPAVDTADLADTGPIDINTNANVLTDGSGRSFFNAIGTIITGGAATGLEIDDSILQGSIVNSGSINSTVDAINVEDSIVAGGLNNTGAIFGGAAGDGIDINSSGIFDGGITNSGVVNAGANAIQIANVIFSGGILNSGVIASTGTAGDAIGVRAGTSFSGGINNTDTGTIIGAGNGSQAIEVAADSFDGGITNDGLISGQVSANAIDITGGVFIGGITNNANGVIQVLGTSDSAILISAALFQGGITNHGLISANPTFDDAIVISGNTFQGGINNTGSITAYSNAVRFSGTLFQDGITNSGFIASASSTAISISGTTFQGGINNQGAGVINASNDAINVSGTTFDGGITNAGTIQSTSSSNALDINGTTFNGGITNSGALLSGSSADAVLISGTTFNGGITNSGLIDGELDGIDINGTSFNGGINNQAAGVITGSSNGINISGTTFTGGITNAGLIQGLTNTGAGILFTGTTFLGGIQNTGSILGDATGISLGGTSFGGGITNSGLIAATSVNRIGIVINTTVFTGGITNNATGVIQAAPLGSFSALAINNASFDGGITNAGLIQGGVSGGDGAYVNATTFSGGINNTGTMQGGGTGLFIDSNTFAGGLTNNAGVIQSTGVGMGVQINSTTFTGGVNNSGLIKGISLTGLLISATTFEGGVTNSGTISGDFPGVNINVTNFSGGFDNAGGLIQGTGASADGVRIVATNFSGGFTNSGSIVGGTSNNSGVDINVSNFFGNFDNSGVILGFNRGAFLDGKLYSGNVSNSGWIDGGEGEGLRLAMNLLAGNVTNTGTITATNDALKVVNGTTITGDVANAGGTIISTSSDAIDVNGVIQGTLSTGSYLYGESNAIDIDGAVLGGIFVTDGWVIGNTQGAIDLTGADGTDPLDPTIGHTLTQTGGTISDNGNANYAIDMDNNFVDTFFANGGAVQGDIEGGEGNVDDMITQSGTFAWHYGLGNQLDEFDVDGGTSILGATARGDTLGAGVFVNAANSMNVAGWAYLDDNTTINLNNGYVQTGAGTLEYFLTTNTGTHGQINASTINLAGDLAAFIDPVSFANMIIPTTTTLLYEDVMTSGGRVGTFDNSASILTSSIFFTGKAFYDGNNVDIGLQRLAFNDALNAIGAIESQNQESVAAAIETIYSNGGYSGDFQDFLEVILAGGLTAPQFQAILDDISGAEHAQLQGSVLALNGILNNFMTERLDGGKLTQGGANMNAALAEQRYAQAAPPPATDATGPRSYGSQGLTRGKSGIALWARVFGQWDHNDGDAEAASFDQDSTGIAGGVDYAINNNAMIGLAGNFANSDIDFDTPGDSAEIDSWQVGGYGSYSFGRFYADGTASYSSHDLSTMRTIMPPVPGAPFSTLAGYDASAWSVAGEIGAIWRLGRVNVQPSARLAWTSSDTDGFTESGSGPGGILDLLVQGADADSLASTVALRGSGVWTMGRTKVVPDIKIGWRHEFSDDRYSFVAAFAEDPSTLFTIVSSGVQEDSAIVSAGATFGVTSNINVFFDVNGNYGSDLSQTNVSGGVLLTW